jgi:chromosomal replication initiation ATPase DnaA
LGGEAFRARAQKAVTGARPHGPPALDAILAAVAVAYDVDAAALADPSRARRISQARGLAGLIARETGAASLSALAARFGRDLSSLSRAVRRVEETVAADGALRARMQAVHDTIMQA